jgi:hypothetical protein
MLDLYGREFALVRFGHDAPDGREIVEAGKSRRVPIAVQTIHDPEPAAIYEARLVLVRPDGHVAWRGSKAPADPMAVIDRIRGSSRRGSAKSGAGT